MSHWGCYWVFGLAACGRIGFEARDNVPPVDTALGDAQTIDESLCAWTLPVRQTALNTTGEEAEPALSPDGSIIVFTSTRLGSTTQRLFSATPVGTSWTTPVLIETLDTPNGSQGPAWNATGDRLYFSSFRTGPLRLFYSTYSPAAGFGTPVLVPGLEGLAESRSPTLRGDELEMLFSSRLPPNHVERATRTSTAAAWTPRGVVSELAGADRGYVGISHDGLALYIEEGGVPGARITRSVRASVNDPWPAPVPVPSLAASNTSGDPQPTRDGTRMVFSSDRADADDFDIWVTTRICP